MKIQEVTDFLESIAPRKLAESYDNVGLLTGKYEQNIRGILFSLDATEDIVLEAINNNCNMIICHHPIIFSGLKKINGYHYVEKAIIAAIKNDIAIYAIHTNLDNVLHGVNAAIADKLGLINRKVLLPKNDMLKKLFTFVPVNNAEKVRSAIFDAGGGHISNYSECSFNVAGQGTFKPGEGTNPFTGTQGKRHTEDEIKMEMIFPAWKEAEVIKAMLAAHPYEEVAYDIIALNNKNQLVGSGLTGDLAQAMSEIEFLKLLKEKFNLSVIKHTPLQDTQVTKIALCGGAGSFLIGAAIASGAQFYITGDIKYHEFFDANNRLVIADIGHYESEQYTIDLLFDILSRKFLNFAVLKTGVKTNPVHYFL